MRVSKTAQPRFPKPAPRPAKQSPRGWEGYPLHMDGPIDNLVRASALHLEAAEAGGCTRRTLSVYRANEYRFLTFLKQEGHAPPFDLALLNVQHVRQAVLWLREHSHGSRDGKQGAKSLVSTLKTWATFLTDEYYFELDPLARLKRPRVPRPSRQPFSTHEIRALISAALEEQFGTRDVTMLLFLLDMGVRIDELCSITLDDLDLKGRKVQIHGKGQLERVLYFGTSERRDGGRTVRYVRRWLEERAAMVAHWRERGDRRATTRVLFLGFDCHPFRPSGFRKTLTRIAQRAEVPNVFPHRFRHTFATAYLLLHKGDETGLRRNLGHLSQEMFQTYLHIAHELLAQRQGRLSLSESWLGADEVDEPPEKPTPLHARRTWQDADMRGAR